MPLNRPPQSLGDLAKNTEEQFAGLLEDLESSLKTLDIKLVSVSVDIGNSRVEIARMDLLDG